MFCWGAVPNPFRTRRHGSTGPSFGSRVGMCKGVILPLPMFLERQTLKKSRQVFFGRPSSFRFENHAYRVVPSQELSDSNKAQVLRFINYFKGLALQTRGASGALAWLSMQGHCVSFTGIACDPWREASRQTWPSEHVMFDSSRPTGRLDKILGE